MKKTKLFFALLLMCFALGMEAQERQSDAELLVNITIVDSNGEPLPGATVKVEGKPVAVVAGADGKVSLWVLKNASITVAYLGMEPRKVTVTKPLSGNFILQSNEQMLDQVVVTGYQRTTKRRITGSVATVNADELKGKPMANLDMMLQGKVAGVDVKAVSGRPGETAKIRIRGTNTITGNAEPLWVVDGVPLQKEIPSVSYGMLKSNDFSSIFASGIAGINPSDIESVTFLKDASAAAIYGSRAAGGVIVVTTKRGQEGKLRVNYSANLSLTTSPPRSANLMNAQEKLAWEQTLWDEFSKTGFEAGTRYPVVGVVGMIRAGKGKYAGLTKEQQDAEIARLGSQTTNWFDVLFRNSVSHSHNLSLSGGSQKATYYISMGYDQNNGLVKKTDYNRYNLSSKVDINANKRVKLGLSLDMAWQRSRGSSLQEDPFTYAYFANPYERVYNDDGSYASDNTYYNIASANGKNDLPLPPNGFNIMREMNETSTVGKNYDMTAIANLSVKLLDNLTFEGLASYGYTTNNSDAINGRNTYAAWLDRPFEESTITSKRTYSSIAQSSSYNSNYTLRGQFQYFNTFNEKHYLSALLGSEVRGQYAKSIFEKRYGYDEVTGNSAFPIYYGVTEYTASTMARYAAIMDLLSGQNRSEDRFASFYFSADYAYNNRYILSFTARTDGSNNFGSDQQFNPTGSLGFSWNVDKEKFFEALKPVMSSLSIRLAAGYTGNVNKTVFPQLIMDYATSFRRTDTDYFRMGEIRKAPNANLRWEKTRDMKLSFDMGFLNERLRLGAEFYTRRTYDAVSEINIPYTTGFDSQSFNTSTLDNAGMELTLSAHFLKTKDWNGRFNANMAYNRNKLVKYTPPVAGYATGRFEGYPLGAIFSGKITGIDAQTGIYAYQLRPDAVLNTAADYNAPENYYYYLGTSNAPVNGGYSFSLSYKQLSLSVGGSYSIGGKVINNINSPVGYTNLNQSAVEPIPSQINDLYVNHLNVTRDVVNRWTPTNPRTDANPRIIDAYGEYLGLRNFMTTSSTITRASILENVSYFKLGSVSLAYSFPEKIVQRWGLGSLSLMATANNLLTITNYSGIDPETPGAVYPMARTYTFGLSIGF